MERLKKIARKLNFGHLKLGSLNAIKTRRKMISLMMMVLLIAFSFIPVASSAPTQNDVAGSWKDSFSDDTGIDLTKSSAINVSGGNVTFDATGWTRDDPWGIEIVDSGVGSNNYDNPSVSIAIDSNDIPYIAYIDTVDKNFKLAHWDNNTADWVKNVVPGCSNVQQDGMVDIVIDSNDSVHVACSASQNSWRAYYNRWNGSSWDSQAQLGTPGRRPSFALSIAVDSNNTPHVAFNHQTNPGILYYTKGPAWGLEVVETFATGLSTNCSIAINSNDVPYIVYDDLYGDVSGSDKVDIRCAVKTGTGWNTKIVRTGANLKGWQTPVSIDIDSSDRLWVIYPHYNPMPPMLNNVDSISQCLSLDGGTSWLEKYGVVQGPYDSGDNSLSSSSSELGMVYKDGSINDALKFGVRMLSDNEKDPWDFMSIDSAQIKETAITSGNNGSFYVAYNTYDGSFFTPTENYVKYAGPPLRGTVISKEITPTVLDSWDTFSAVDDTTHGNIVYSILDGNNFSVLKSNVTSGQDISDIDATAHPTIRLKASISATGNPVVSAILQSWGVTWIPDATSPVFGNLEAWDKDDNWIDDTPPNNVVADYLTSPKVTIHSDFNDGLGLGIFDHKIKYTENDWADTITYNCGGVGSCLVDICAYDEDGDGVPEISCPLPAGTEIKYKSEATDNAIPPNPTTYSPEKSFTVIDLSVTLTAAPNPVDVGNNTTLTAAVGGSAMGAITYKFDCGDGGGWGPIVAVNTATCNYAVAGTYTARVEVTRQGIMATNTTSITVNPPNNPPTASITCNPASCQAYIYNSTSIDSCGLELQNASADPEDCLGGYPCVIPPNDKGFSSCLWEIDGGFCPVADCSDCSGINFSLTAGNHTADLTVTDQGGLSSSSSRNITFKKDAYADFKCSINGGAWEDCDNLTANPKVGDTIGFRADDGVDGLSTRSDGSGGWNNFDWDFSDGVGTGVVTSHIYNVKGAYTVTLTVTDSAMRHARRSYTINVGTTVPEFPKNWREIAPSL